MLALKQQELKPEAPPRKVKLRWDVLFSDLSLLIALMGARFIVWRTLRRRRQERAARHKRFKLLQGGGHHAEQRVAPS
jgi:hypothetical protein